MRAASLAYKNNLLFTKHNILLSVDRVRTQSSSEDSRMLNMSTHGLVCISFVCTIDCYYSNARLIIKDLHLARYSVNKNSLVRFKIMS